MTERRKLFVLSTIAWIVSVREIFVDVATFSICFSGRHTFFPLGRRSEKQTCAIIFSQVLSWYESLDEFSFSGEISQLQDLPGFTGWAGEGRRTRHL